MEMIFLFESVFIEACKTSGTESMEEQISPLPFFAMTYESSFFISSNLGLSPTLFYLVLLWDVETCFYGKLFLFLCCLAETKVRLDIVKVKLSFLCRW